MSEMSNLRATVRRQSTPGSLVLLICTALVFGPRVWDYIIGEPWIDNQLMIVENSSHEIIVEDLTYTKEPVHGLRVNTVEADDGDILCSTEHHNSWHGERKRFWRLGAFTGCAPQQESFRVCSRFSVSSGSGRTRLFGPFCSPYMAASEVSDSSSK
ncbi:hypothetical protein [Aquamicrobium zhengzhouense]|uniref:Uncharacterized protein n=1 Tax=Aquamicrobium zhengzhouense TaxID=2781738 RepID=A0ABS0SC68_9HYPH|nr:hypothetical protein [Aquamicrobium zhengzhouense]MBI1620033.1 hypothetical protein [Aquamicrobium zhengzhouense]